MEGKLICRTFTPTPHSDPLPCTFYRCSESRPQMQALLPAGQNVVSRGSGGDEGTGHRVNVGQKVKCFPSKMG